jgi:hypothetical protein
MALFKSTIVIWTDYNPAAVDLEDLAKDADSGDAYLEQQSYVIVRDEDVPDAVKSFMCNDEGIDE